MAVEKMKSVPSGDDDAERGSRFPRYALEDSVEVARLLHQRGGGAASADHLASYLGYKSTNNGAYLARLAAARAFNLVSKSGQAYVPTALAHQILSPVYPDDVKKGLVEAFFSIELFKKIHDDFRGRELPPEAGLKNALRTRYGVIPSRVDVAYRSLMASAEFAGFFEVRNGARTHLIPPVVYSQAPRADAARPADVPLRMGGDDGGGGKTPGDAGEPQRASKAGLDDVKARYVETLISLFEKKSSEGQLDEALMERIERILAIKPDTEKPS